jgi:hypothetical protein
VSLLFLPNICNLTRCKLRSCSFKVLRAGDSMAPHHYPSRAVRFPGHGPGNVSPPLADAWAGVVAALNLEAQLVGPAAIETTGSPLITLFVTPQPLRPLT